MAILNVVTDFAGQIGVVPRLVRVQSTDNLATITAAGYLNSYPSEGISIAATDIVCVSYIQSTVVAFGFFQPIISGKGVITLEQTESSVILPVLNNHFAIWSGTTGSLKSDANTAINSGNIQAGLSGTAGYLASFPATASTGSLQLVAVANTGNTVTSISNAAMGQASVISIPDPGAATASFVVSAAALVSNNLVKASGTTGLVVDAGARIISNTTAAFGGGGTTHSFTATGLSSTSVGTAVILASTNSVSITKAVPGTNTLAITFSADPGAATTVNYIYTTATQS